MLKGLAQGAVFLGYAAENTRQRTLLERIEETLRQHGHFVKKMALGEVATQSRDL